MNPSQIGKIINDPVNGFIRIKHPLVQAIIDHPYFQRLRRIKQMGSAELVYPGANHTRFHHSLGAYHLMGVALHELQLKGIETSKEERLHSSLAILLHDIGHGPFSHALEKIIIPGLHHESLSKQLIQVLNEEFNGKLEQTLAIFNNTYTDKPWLHALISSQYDMDRMDYLNRDSYYTGVSEGVIGSDRIIAMLDVADNQLVVEQKGVYSIEKFLVARRLMYWQVYMHKTVVSSEVMLTFLLRRAKMLVQSGKELFASPPFKLFLEKDIELIDFEKDPTLLNQFALLDDFDIMGAVKVWQFDTDKVLSLLATQLINRKLFKIEISTTPFSKERIQYEIDLVKAHFDLDQNEAGFFVSTAILRNNAYNEQRENINLLMKDGSVKDVSQAADNLNIHALSEPVEKYFLCYPSPKL